MSRSYLSQFKEDEIVALTGISSSTFEYLFNKYCGVGTPIRRPEYLWYLFQFYKLYPIHRAFRTIHGGKLKSKRSFQSRLYAWQRYLALKIDELDAAWDNRKHIDNALPHVFERNVTGSIDSFPIIINRPKRHQSLFYNGKYSCHVVKVQGVCDHRGNLIWYSGPHVGTISDISLFRKYSPPLEPGEKLLGDKAYVGERSRLLAPYKKKKGQIRLSRRKYDYNNVHAWYRATIEHCFAFVKRFRILNSVYRGHVVENVEYLAAALKIIIHSNYVHTRDHPQRNHQPMDLELDEIDAAEVGPIDPELGSGYKFEDFSVGQIVLVWHLDSWWHGKVVYKSRTETLSVRLTGAREQMSGILPKNLKPAA